MTTGARPWLAIALALIVAAPAFGQVRPPWASVATPAAPAGETVSESQLPTARARLEAPSPVWVGQAVPVVVEVIVPTWFTDPPAFADLQVPDAVTLSPEPSWNFVVQSGRQSFSGQARRYLLFPQSEGRCSVPAQSVSVTYAVTGGVAPRLRTLTTNAITFQVRVPPGASGAKYFVTTDGLGLTQTLTPHVVELKVGDSVTRTITMTASGTVGMSLPPLQFEAPDGLVVYPGVPRVADHAERGDVRATRTETATFVARRDGHYRLPEITVLWWNPRTRVMNHASAPAVEFDVRATTAYQVETFAEDQTTVVPLADARADWRALLAPAVRRSVLPAAVTIALLLARRLLRRRRPSGSSVLGGWRTRRDEAEGTWFRRFRRAALSGDPHRALRSLMSWLDRGNTRPRVPTLARFAGDSRVPTLPEEVVTLERVLFAARAGATDGQNAVHGRWRGWRLLDAAGRARRRLNAAGHATRPSNHWTDGAASALPAQLNPPPTSGP